MSVLKKIFGRDSGGASATPPAAPTGSPAETECAHLALTPRWDSLEDMGKEDRATAYICDACHQSFTPTEAERARSASAARMRQVA